MYEMIQLSGHSHYIECPAKIGLVENGNGGVVAIDSGSDRDAGKKLMRILKERGWKLEAVLNTHSHADHIGGNKYLQDQCSCPVYAPGLECDFTNHTLLEPACLYGGFPMKDLHHKFLMAQPSNAQALAQQNLPGNLQIIPLPGHSFDMVGFRTDEDVVYLADCLSSRETLDKYGVGYLWDVAAYLNTLEQVKRMQARIFVPAHAAATEDIAPLAQYNIDAVCATGSKIVELCDHPRCFEELLQGLFAAFDMKMNLQQYVLIGSTLRSYLSWLKDRGELSFTFEDNRMLWYRS